MYELTINNKQVTINVTKESGVAVFASECEGQHFHSAIAPRGAKLYLLVDKPIVGVGMYSEDQETLKAMQAEYKELAGGIRSESDSDDSATT
jgi:hypothetical protein